MYMYRVGDNSLLKVGICIESHICMYHRPRPEGPGLALYPPLGVNELRQRRGNEGIEEASKAAGRRHPVKCASNLHSYLCHQVCKWYA